MDQLIQNQYCCLATRQHLIIGQERSTNIMSLTGQQIHLCQGQNIGRKMIKMRLTSPVRDEISVGDIRQQTEHMSRQGQNIGRKTIK
jgi:hypothetical protein